MIGIVLSEGVKWQEERIPEKKGGSMTEKCGETILCGVLREELCELRHEV